MREISSDTFVLGCHRFGLGPPPEGGPVDVDKHVVPMVRTALELGIRTFDSATLYRATLQLGQALEKLNVDPNSVQLQTKCLRYLGLQAGDAKEHQPEALLKSIPARYHGLTDKWDASPKGVEAQVCQERILFGSKTLLGVALHDVPDMEDQVGLEWERDVTPAVAALKEMKANKFIEKIGLGVKVPEFVLKFVERESDSLDYAGVTFCPAILDRMMPVIEGGAQHNYTVTLMGINYGQAFTLREDPAIAPPFLYNYAEANAEQRNLMSRFFKACGSTPLLHLAAAVAGQLVVHFPKVVTQIVTSTLTPSRLVETLRLVREAEIPAPVWAELKAMELIPKEFPVN
jgi:hypothetical protein